MSAPALLLPAFFFHPCLKLNLLFVMGTAMFPAGIVGMLIFLMLGVSFIIAMPILSLGLIYLIIGVANRDKWKKAS
ncbi:hypothetical protein MUP07_06975 [Candidatus Bathyarchaeota archaeon]|nr:hypothetical protein [Candidatus Bathyarchaeota archaeon]